MYKVYFNELHGRRIGRTTLFCFQIIGVAELSTFSWDKIKCPIVIPCDQPLKWIDQFIRKLEEICKVV